MTKHEWIFDVLLDVAAYARKNTLLETYEQACELALTVRRETQATKTEEAVEDGQASNWSRSAELDHLLTSLHPAFGLDHGLRPKARMRPCDGSQSQES